ncbi:putative histone-lysine N-methyltransferase PRDM6 isoform X2 [Montipora capricornis]|uniref:putative histone-lysine N-methyltransferase PRDM6 isoform X2 n=1 Tax=Montipora capricornis TaxID=246305 RepID=UPI0035F15130
MVECGIFAQCQAASPHKVNVRYYPFMPSKSRTGENMTHQVTMDSKAGQSAKPDHTREKSPSKKYLLFNEKTVQFLLYGKKKSKIIEVNKLKRKTTSCQEPSPSKKQQIAADVEEPRLTSAMRSFPDEVQLCVSSIPGALYGVCAKQHIPLGTWIGPYEGKRITPQRLTPDIDSDHLWEIFKDGSLSHFLDGSDEDNSSWMRFIRCARHVKEQNLYAFQYCENIFYRAFKEIPPGRELLVWYDDKYPEFYGIPLAMHDYEFIRESVSSSTSRGSRKPGATTTQVSSIEHDHKMDVLLESQENPRTENSRISSAQPMQPRLVRPTYSTRNSFTREQVIPSDVTDTPRYKETLLQDIGRNKRSDVPTSLCHTQPFKAFCQPSLSSDGNFIHSETRSKDLPKIEKPIHSEKLLSKAYVSTKETSVLQGKEPSSASNKGLLQKTFSATQVSSTQFTDNDEQISTRIMEGNASKLENTSERPMPALQPYITKAPPLHRHVNTLYYEPVSTQTSGIPIEEFGMWRCRQCLKTFTQRVSLQMHQCSQLPKKPYQCGQCRLSFATSSELRSHVELHTNDKLFKCGFCSRTFSGATTLNNHIRTHTGEKPFICEKCNKTFSQASHLARHQRNPGECVEDP